MIPRIALPDGYAVPRIIVGAWQQSSGHAQSPGPIERTFRAWDHAHALGADTLDCADIYTGVETLIGRYRADRIARGLEPGRVHTKLVPDLAALASVDRSYLTRIVDRSLDRLGVERLDLVQLHWWDYAVPGYRETLGELDRLRRSGKIGRIGLTNFDSARLGELIAIGIPITSIQVQYSLLDRRPERSLAALCQRSGIGLLCYGVLAGGFLTDRWLGRTDPGPGVANRSLVKYRLMIDECGGWDAVQSLLETLARVARRHEVGIGAVAIRAMWDRPGVSATIVGITDPTQIEELARAAALSLTAGDRSELAAAVAALDWPAGEVYELERIRDGVHGRIMRYDGNAT